MLLANEIYTLIKSAEVKVFTKDKLQLSKISKTASACCTNTIAIDIICDLLLNRHTATWNLFVSYNKELKYTEKKF